MAKRKKKGAGSKRASPGRKETPLRRQAVRVLRLLELKSMPVETEADILAFSDRFFADMQQSSSDEEEDQWLQMGLALCPLAPDVQLALGMRHPTQEGALMEFQKALQMAERCLGADLLQKWRTHPEEHVSPVYLRAAMMYLSCLIELERYDEAITYARGLLTMNPQDTRGICMVATRVYLLRDQDAEFRTIITRQYPQPTVFSLYTLALLDFRAEGDSPRAQASLLKALEFDRRPLDMLLDYMDFAEIETKLKKSPEMQDVAAYVLNCRRCWINTPGAISWARRIYGELSLRKQVARTLGTGPTDRAKAKLKKLPQVLGEEWQVQAVKGATWSQDWDYVFRPWVVVVIDVATNQIIGTHVFPYEPEDKELWSALASTLQKPLVGEPRRPSEIQVRENTRWERLQAHLQEIDIDCIYRPELAELDAALASLQDAFLQQGAMQGEIPRMLSVPGVTPELVREYFSAMADLLRSGVFQHRGVTPQARLQSPRIPHEDYYVSLMGSLDDPPSLALYCVPDERLPQAKDDDEFPDMEQMLEALEPKTVMFTEAFEMPMGDIIDLEQQGWEVVHPEAYPLVVCPDQEGGPRRPNVAELELLIAVAKCLPEFLQLAKATKTTAMKEYQPLVQGQPFPLKLIHQPDLEAFECPEDAKTC